ncbi:hypothetical protein MRX96_048582 [Rhipicephalus microplus]
MDTERRALYRKSFPEGGTAEGREGRWSTGLLTSLVIVCLGLLCSILVIAYLVSSGSSEQDSTTADKVTTLDIPETPTIKLSWSSDDNREHARNTSESTPSGQAHVVPIPHSDSNDCTGLTCRLLANWLRESIDYTVSPCDDFYKHVCGKYRGYNTFFDVQRDLDLSIRSYLLISEIPKSNQLSWQKAAAMYHACISYTSSYEPETKYLVRWMVSLNLDLLNDTRLMNVNPVEMMVRGSLDFGVEAILSIVLEEKQFEDGKRVVTVRK